MMRVVILFLAVYGSAGFAPLQLQDRRCRKESSLRNQVLDDVDAICIMNAANLCSIDDYFCSLDEEEALLNRLESQAYLLEIRLNEMRGLVFAMSDRPRLASREIHQVSRPALSEIDTLCLMNTAAFCAEEGCDLEDEEAIVARLQEQYTAWNRRLIATISAMRRLEMHNMENRMQNPEVYSLMQSIEDALTMNYDMTDNKVPISSFE